MRLLWGRFWELIADRQCTHDGPTVDPRWTHGEILTKNDSHTRGISARFSSKLRQNSANFSPNSAKMPSSKNEQKRAKNEQKRAKTSKNEQKRAKTSKNEQKRAKTSKNERKTTKKRPKTTQKRLLAGPLLCPVSSQPGLCFRHRRVLFAAPCIGATGEKKRAEVQSGTCLPGSPENRAVFVKTLLGILLVASVCKRKVYGHKRSMSKCPSARAERLNSRCQEVVCELGCEVRL